MPKCVDHHSKHSTIPAIYKMIAHAADWRDSDYQRADIRSPETHTTPALFFIHGLEYHHPDEVLRDLVYPFLESTPNISAHTRIYFLYWPSCISSQIASGSSAGSSHVHMHHKLLETTRRGWRFGLERRMRTASELLSDWIMDHGEPHGLFNITVVSHSLGARVWSHTVKRLLKNPIFTSLVPGPWINLQPALDAEAFADRSEFTSVAQYYAQHGQPISVVHSRYDMILSSAYRLATGKTAMGLVGARGAESIRSFDVTRSVGEAHGHFHLSRRSGSFFKRSGLVLQRLIEGAMVPEPS